MPSRLGNAFSAASFVSTTRCPRAPLGARSLGTSTSVRHPSNGRRFGCPFTSGNSTAIAATAKPRVLHNRASISLKHSSWLLFLCPHRSLLFLCSCHRQRRQTALHPHLLLCQNACLQQLQLNLHFSRLIAAVEFIPYKPQVVPPQPLRNDVA